MGLFQTLALLAGISRSGTTMVGGLLRGLDHEDAAKFSLRMPPSSRSCWPPRSSWPPASSSCRAPPGPRPRTSTAR
ncbi:undecaprenyl-diphosphate phosphatase [Streptomyces sp. NBC_01571]|uniref:undecaprenyl-diphosphate phosphatase n=1 Tax=Streptomyces sp. NBC_01571 TaxID=2975883 RepID=UPI00338E3CC3